MILFALRRLVYAVITLLVVVTVVFLLARASGNPAELMAPPQSTADDLERIERSLGLDQPLVVQYGKYLSRLVQGDLGESFSFREPVSSLIADALPNSVRLGLAAFAFALVCGVTIGMVSALRPGTWGDRFGKAISLLGQSVPSFWLGMVLVLVFAVNLQWFPAYGSGSFRHVVLPAIALGWLPLASIARLTRSAVLEVLRADHTLFERSKGVSRVVYLTHVLRNASLPVVTLAGIQLGWLVSGTVVIETLFAWPGTGFLAIQAINSRDYNVVQGVALAVTAVFVLLLFIVDLSYGWLDPRTRSGTRSVGA